LGSWLYWLLLSLVVVVIIIIIVIIPLVVVVPSIVVVVIIVLIIIIIIIVLIVIILIIIVVIAVVLILIIGIRRRNLSWFCAKCIFEEVGNFDIFLRLDYWWRSWGWTNRRWKSVGRCRIETLVESWLRRSWLGICIIIVIKESWFSLCCSSSSLNHGF